MALRTSIPYNDYGPKLQALVKWPTDAKGKPVLGVMYQTLMRGQQWEWTADNQRLLVDTHPGIMIAGRDQIWDAEVGDVVQIAYYTTQKIVDGAVEPSILPVEFISKDRGFLWVPFKGGQKLYQFLQLMNANKDCVNPDHEMPSIGYLFERVKPEVVAEKQLDLIGETFRVGGIVQLMEEDALRKLAPKLGIPDTLEPKQLLVQILLRVQRDPKEVNDLLDTEQLRIQDEVRKAIGKKLVEFDPTVGAFVVYGSREPLAVVPSDTVDKVDAFSTFLSSREGRSARDKVRNLLDSKRAARMQAQAPAENFDDEEEDEQPARAPRPVPGLPKVAKAAKAKTEKKAPPVRGKKAAPAATAPEPAAPAVPHTGSANLDEMDPQ